MVEAANTQLTERQREILRGVVEEYVESGQPVGSRNLVTRAGMTVSPRRFAPSWPSSSGSVLTHPHTSAGRVPTEAGYRFYADSLLERLEPRPSPFPLELAAARSELEAALQETTETLPGDAPARPRVAPPLQTATVRHVEVLVLQPQVLMVVVITSTGSVSKRVFALAEPVDTGLALWAGEYLNDQIAGLELLGSTVLRRRFEDPGLSPRELEVLELLRPAFTELVGEHDRRLFVGGAASLLGEVRSDELEACQRLLEALEKRAAILEMLGETLGSRRPFVRVGGELENPALREVCSSAPPWPLDADARRRSLVGPLRMDYEKAIRSVPCGGTRALPVRRVRLRRQLA